jgi:NAD(P)H-dependent FMN reductase
MMTISVIVGSTHQGRFSEKPAQWILQQLHKREGIEGRLLRNGWHGARPGPG